MFPRENILSGDESMWCVGERERDRETERDKEREGACNCLHSVRLRNVP